MATPNKDKPALQVSDEHLIDREQAFMIFASFCGDVARTAHALNLAPATVLRVVDEEGWTAKLAPILELKKGTRPGDVERAMNRALNFVQAHRARLMLGRVLAHVEGLVNNELTETLFPNVHNKDGTVKTTFSARAFADLTVALEKAQAMTYIALNDTAPERVKRKDNGPGGDSVNEMHAKLAEAMAEVSKSKTPRAMLLDAQLVEADALLTLAVKPAPAAHPNDDDDH
jgi:hypothetical protein